MIERDDIGLMYRRDVKAHFGVSDAFILSFSRKNTLNKNHKTSNPVGNSLSVNPSFMLG